MYFIGFVVWCFFGASAYNLMMLTLERHYAITKPMQYDQEKVFKRLPFIMISAWIIGFGVVTPVSLFFSVVGDTCMFTLPVRFPFLFTILSPYFIVFIICIPSMVMVAAYAHMGISLKNSGFSSKTNSQAQKNLFYTCLILVMMFVTTGINHMVSLILQTVDYYPHSLNIPYQVSAGLMFLNAMINPLIYCARYKEFQKRGKELLGFAKPGSNVYSQKTDSIKISADDGSSKQDTNQ